MSKQPGGIIIGQKGVQYGLQKVQQMYEEALAADPTAFDYDGVYDSIQEARVAPKQQDKVQRESKYIASLLDQAQQRKREQDVLYERRMVKERQQEDHLYEDKERFVTSAYRKKLEEDKKWQEAERQKELEEQRNDVRRVGHLGNFYANLLTKNVAYGTAKPGAAEAAAAGDKKQSREGSAEGERAAERGPSSEREGSPAPRRGEAGGQGGAREAQERSASPAGGAGPSAKVLAQLDRYNVLRLEAERAMREKRMREQQQGQGQGGEGAEEARGGSERDAAGGSSRQEGAQQPSEPSKRVAASAAPRAAGSGTGGTEAAGSGAAVEPAGGVEPTAAGQVAGGAGAKRRNDESAVLSARERYLARKQQKTG
ncbi:hypothetical protein GPECTOR_28g752 [Gonium pectorale]|uniref:Nuclear speckle splicing regulatory protein 1 N-terminal domain-containing protein n=1 Tax=Gonium pectorale TaxID=33097 RepID=A0A150GFH9_GONPE|nr:hypothetical protein GPECTOR_28g752 [Gonium pectorale]|eukprot:KXZ48345.1 hypothetical protein GPECTOR_28g752 [Gonium pectorale]